jgi:hypothetical protein
MVLRGNYPFRPGSGIVTRTMLRRQKEKILGRIRALRIPGWHGKPLQQLSNLGRALLRHTNETGPVILKELGLKSAGNIQSLRHEYGPAVYGLIKDLTANLATDFTRKIV